MGNVLRKALRVKPLFRLLREPRGMPLRALVFGLGLAVLEVVEVVAQKLGDRPHEPITRHASILGVQVK